jgi:signal transduction histidine kinase
MALAFLFSIVYSRPGRVFIPIVPRVVLEGSLLVTSHGMNLAWLAKQTSALLSAVDPRRSLLAGAMSLIIGLTLTFSIAAAVWVGRIARDNVLQQHARRLSLETDQLSSDMSLALAAYLGAVRAASAALQTPSGGDPAKDLRHVFEELVYAYPHFDWVAVADRDGLVADAHDASLIGTHVDATSWFKAGIQGAWIGAIGDRPQSNATAPTMPSPGTSTLGDIAFPITDTAGNAVGVIAAHLTWQRSPNHAQRLTDEINARSTTRAYVLNRSGLVLIGPDGIRGTRWLAEPLKQQGPIAASADDSSSIAYGPLFERLPDGSVALIARASVSAAPEWASQGLQVQLSEPLERVYQRANAVATEILWVSIGLGVATAGFGALGALHLTRRLKRLSLSVASIGRTPDAKIDVPSGRDEVAQLGAAFSTLIGELSAERGELKTLSAELERRVAVRTREVERLADESRYAAIVRERLKMARDLHDTLAHSIMAILLEIRFIRKLPLHSQSSLEQELAKAEELAHAGLKEARAAITQMRMNTVRETGLGPSVSNALNHFTDHTGVTGEFHTDPEAAGFGDDRAETLMRMVQEVLRNVERHASATHVKVNLQVVRAGFLELRIEDNGRGFDPKSIPEGHYGLIGLREQAELIGARLLIESTPGEGTSVSITLQISPMPFSLDSQSQSAPLA